MGQTKTTIELNGNLYDANTGAMLDSSTASSKPAPKRPSQGGVVDGFYRGPAPAALSPMAVVQPVKVVKPTPHRTASTAKTGHKLEHSHTLMRRAVHKPKMAPPASTPSQVKEKGLTQPDTFWQDRKKRAQQISKSSSISRFNAFNPIKPKLAPLEVKSHPPDQSKKAVKPAKLGQAVLSTHTNSPSFQKALQAAQSHTQKAPHTPKMRHRAAKKLGVSTRVINIASVSLVVVLLTGFVAYQNVANLSVRLASNQAGFHASLPGYTPSGFGMAGAVQASPGAVTISFRSHSDNRSFEVSQKESNWTSDSLLNNYVAASKSYQTVEDKGKTIYIYGDNNATWVNGGIWYQIAGNANLSNEQILHIADSL